MTLSDEQVDELFALVKANPGMSFEVDLEGEVVKAGDKTYSFSIDAFRRHCMLNGLDSIGLTLQHEDAISAYEKNSLRLWAKDNGPQKRAIDLFRKAAFQNQTSLTRQVSPSVTTEIAAITQ